MLQSVNIMLQNRWRELSGGVCQKYGGALLRREFSCFEILAAFLILVALSGCASGPGVNKRQFFSENDKVVLPVKAVLDESSAKLETVAQWSGMTKVQMFMTSGIVGALLLDEPKVGKAIRGGFMVGQAFAEDLAGMSTDSADTLTFKIKSFNHYAVPGMLPSLKALMYFETTNDKQGFSTLSAYACDWESRGPIISGGTEKDMLREMVDYSLNHWGRLYLTNRTESGFPAPQRGTFTGEGVKCAYDVFVRP